MAGILVDRAHRHDLPDWVAMREELWPGTSAADHQLEAEQMLADKSGWLSLMVRTANGNAVGFAEASIRHDYVNGCETSPVGFLEGIYVREEFRRQGIARQLVEAVERWVRSHGCRELASDTAPGNFGSQHMHASLGFEETQRVVYFRKAIG